MLVQVLWEAGTKRGLGEQETYWGHHRREMSREARRAARPAWLPSGRGEEREESGGVGGEPQPEVRL